MTTKDIGGVKKDSEVKRMIKAGVTAYLLYNGSATYVQLQA
jgi:hypothetical protein